MKEKEQVKATRAGAWLDSLWRDLRYGARTLRKNPGFSVVAVATLALVIGANTAIFSAFYGLVFRHLPYTNVDRLVMLWESDRRVGSEHSYVMGGTLPMYRAAKSFDGFAGFSPPYLPSATEPHATGLWGEDGAVVEAPCSGELFQILGVNPILGRGIQPGDSHRDIAVLSEHFWRQHYGARPDVIGKPLKRNSFGFRIDYTIVGVLPDWFEFPYPLVAKRPDVWLSTYFIEDLISPGGGAWVLARLKPGVSLRQAQSEVDTIAARIRADHPKEYGQARVDVVSLSSELSHDVRGVLWILLIALVLVLLIGCANVINLLLVRAFTREKEMALRSALGAARITLIRQLLVEAGLLATVGGVLGLFVAYWGLRAFFGLMPSSMYVPRFQEVALDPRVLGVTTVVSIAATLIVSVLPSLRLSRASQILRAGVAIAARGNSVFRRPGSALLVLESSLALVLLVGMVLLTTSVHRLLAINEQFQPEHMLTLSSAISNGIITEFGKNPDNFFLAYQNFQMRLAALPEVRSAVLVDRFPFLEYPHNFKAINGGGEIASSKQPAEMHVVTPNFFGVMGYELKRGRWLADADMRRTPHVAVINDVMAARYWPDRDPIGISLLLTDYFTDPKDAFTIVGVTGEPRRFGNGGTEKPAVYLSYAQMEYNGPVALVLTQGDPRRVAGAIREAALDIVPGQTFVGTPRTGEEWVSESSARLRFTTMLVSVFSALALLLALIGIYGVISYHTAQRTREIGIRMALGSTPGGVLRLVLGEGMALISIGTVIGLVAAYAFAKSLASLLYDVRSTDTSAFVGSALLFFAVASAAFFIPARRASRVDPMDALRYE